MAYDETLTQRIRVRLDLLPGYSERRMFGGIAFLLYGNMACGVLGDELVVRVGPDRFDAALSLPHCRPFDFTGRPMQGWIMVEAEVTAEESDLTAWIDSGVAFALSLPAKGAGG